MKIIHVPRRLVVDSWGGTETVVLETCKALQAQGHSCQIWCSSALSRPGADSIDGVRVRRFPYFYPHWKLSEQARHSLDLKGGNLFSWHLLWALLREPQVDLVHLHTGKRLGGIVRTACSVRKIPYIMTLHGGVHDVPESEERSFTAPTEGAIEWGKALGLMVGSRRVLEDAHSVLCLGQGELQATQQAWPRSRPRLFPNGVDAERFSSGDGSDFRRRHGIAPDAFVVLTMGRIDPQKNQLLSLEMLRQDPTLHLLLVGPITNPDYRARLQSFIDDHRLGSRLTWLPGLKASDPDLVAAYHGADLFFLPSVHEPFGIVVLEAWAAGLPVLASRVGGLANLIENGRDGLLFEPDRPDQAAQALNLLRGDQPLRQALAWEGSRKAQQTYSWDKVCGQLLGIYQEALA
jgi:glycosyltransferase involved in cell wall biosynthesis